MNSKKKQDKDLVYNSQHSFTKLKELSHDSMYKIWFILKKINKFKTVDLQTNEYRVLKPKVLDNVGDLFNELYYISIHKYNEEKDGLNTKKKKTEYFYYKKLRLTDDYQYESEEEKKEEGKGPAD